MKGRKIKIILQCVKMRRISISDLYHHSISYYPSYSHHALWKCLTWQNLAIDLNTVRIFKTYDFIPILLTILTKLKSSEETELR